jgi:TatD DNase family protein
MEAFSHQLRLAKELRKSAVIHTREAIDDTWKVLQEVGYDRVVIHCCTEAWSDIERFVAFGCFLSFTGIATYPKSDAIRDTIKHCPLERMMIETDAPYLAPVPHRGKRNEPAFVKEVAACIAEVKGISVEEVDQRTTDNAERFFEI